jgi:hypothetical protein
MSCNDIEARPPTSERWKWEAKLKLMEIMKVGKVKFNKNERRPGRINLYSLVLLRRSRQGGRLPSDKILDDRSHNARTSNCLRSSCIAAIEPS